MRRKGIVITIDGPSGAGKGTVAKAIAEKLNLNYIDTGAMYRTVALLAQRRGINIDDERKLKVLLLEAHISFKRDDKGKLRVFLGEEDVTEEIRKPEISRLSSQIATKKVVRDILKVMQRRMGRGGNIVVEGRDMGNYVFPEADFKFYLNAKLEERAKRRWLQLKEMGMDIDMEEVKREIEERDRQDMERNEAPLHPAKDAVIIDTTGLNVEEVVERILNAMEALKKKNG